MDKGYFIFASGDEFIRNAYALALSIKNTQEINSVCIAIGWEDELPKEYSKVFENNNLILIDTEKNKIKKIEF